MCSKLLPESDGVGASTVHYPEIESKYSFKRAFITGAASGLGLAIARCLAADGWRLLIVDLNRERLEQAERELKQLGADTVARVMDVTQLPALQEAADLVTERWQGVDLVFNNAGIALVGAIDELTIRDWERVIAVDLWSVIYGCHVFVPLLKRQGGGHIINTASSAGTLAGPEMACYNVAKAGVVSLSETLKAELGKDGIGVTVACPTVFVTSLGDTMAGARPMESSLLRQLKHSRVSAETVARDVLRAVADDRLYVMSQADARWGWRLKRLFPELYPRLMGYLYRNKKWIYSR